MGASGSIETNLVEKPVVVIVGAGYAGVECARALEGKMNVILIDRKEYFFHNVAALRGAVVEDWENKICIPYDHLLTTGSFVKGDAIEIGAKHVKLNGHEKEIKFDYLVLATGTSYAFPAKIPVDQFDHVKLMYRQLREHIATSKKILIIGGGPVGIELAGEISYHHEDKEVTLVHSGGQLVSSRPDLSPKLGGSLLNQLAFRKVDVLLNEKIDFESLFLDEAKNQRFLVGKRTARTFSGKEIETDLVFFCNGSHINSSVYRDKLGGAVSEHGEIHVNEYFQVNGFQNIFAIGDCCDADHKMSFLAVEQGVGAANNIISHSQDCSMTPYKKGWNVMSVPIGPLGGATQLPFLGVIGALVTSSLKGSELFVPKTWRMLGFDGPPTSNERPSQAPESESESDRKKNLMAALKCDEEEVEKIQAQLLPLRNLPADANHL